MAGASASLRDYTIRRFLLVPFTLLGALLLVYFIIRLAPGPVEEEIRQRMSAAGGEKTQRAERGSGGGLRPEEVFTLQEDYDRDRSPIIGFGVWAGLLPRETRRTAVVFEGDAKEAKTTLKGTTIDIAVHRDDAKAWLTGADGADVSDWRVRLMTPQELNARWKAAIKSNSDQLPDMPWRAMVYKPVREGLLQGTLGRSRKYQDKVWDMILERMPISLFFGIVSSLIIYGVSLPLGIVKALKHRSSLDSVSSIVVFSGFAIPSYVMGSLLLSYFAAQLGWFPLRDFTGENFDQLSFFGKVGDVLRHSALPLLCYVAGGFAFLTMMMKNSLMDNLAADYMRTAVAKGVPYRRAVFKHALRNSFIPIATTIGSLVSVFMAGNFIIESIFDINGMGLLVFNAIQENDDMVILGTITVTALLMMLGNIISDLAVAFVDPRVSYK